MDVHTLEAVRGQLGLDAVRGRLGVGLDQVLLWKGALMGINVRLVHHMPSCRLGSWCLV
jgi:hypothetical protein